MSSWTNRTIPRRRDLTHIPDIYRPVIVTRAENPHVVLSETFQAPPPIAAAPSTPSAFDRFLRSVDQPAQPSRGLPTPSKAPAPRAIELRRAEGTVVFVILRHLRSNKDNDLWISSYNSIRQYYTNPIVIIDDASTVNTINGKLVNTEVIYSEYSGAGEVLPYYYFWKNRWADHMIFLHDSMFLARPFRKEELDGKLRFLWHFTEPTERKLETYLTMLQAGAEAWNDLQTTGWHGCFGAASMVSLEAVDQLEEVYEVWSRLVLAVRARVDRKMFERILGVLAGREGLTDGKGIFGDITKYPDAFESQAQTLAAAQRLAAGYDTAVWKVWKGR